MKRLALLLILACLLSGCAGFSVGPNTATGAAIGAIGGAIIDRGNPARGAIIGGGAGAILGGIADEDARQRREDEWRRQEEARRWYNYCQRNWRYDHRCR